MIVNIWYSSSQSASEILVTVPWETVGCWLLMDAIVFGACFRAKFHGNDIIDMTIKEYYVYVCENGVNILEILSIRISYAIIYYHVQICCASPASSPMLKIGATNSREKKKTTQNRNLFCFYRVLYSVSVSVNRAAPFDPHFWCYKQYVLVISKCN